MRSFEIQRRRPGADATFLVSYSEGYVASQLIRVRRLADKDRGSHSLASLIQKVAVNPRVQLADETRRHQHDID